jgi:hypothetical protein
MPFSNPGDLIKPWDWNVFLELVVWGFVVLLVGGIWTWTRSGWTRKHTPDILARNIEDFAGVTQEANGPVPIFLLLLYLVVALFLIGYPLVTLIFNYNY